MTKCPICGEWHDLKGVYICPACGSKDMVQAANEPISVVEIWQNRIDTLNEVCKVQQRHINEVEDLLKRVIAMMLDELDEKEKAQLFLDVESYIGKEAK